MPVLTSARVQDVGSRRAQRTARWSAIGCGVHLETRRSADLAPARALTERILRDIDEVASRFRSDSDLSRVNAAAGGWVRVDPLLVAAVTVAVDAARSTDGLVHPLLGRPLVEWGYDRTFARLTVQADRRAPSSPPPSLDSWCRIELADDAVRIPADTALDLGATAKAWIVDLTVAALRDDLGVDAVVSVGGDLRTSGDTAWTVAVAERPDDAPDELVQITGAVATSSTQARRWTSAGAEQHHLIDPRTGAPAIERWRTVTVAAPTCVAANVASTAAILLGEEAPAWLAGRGLAARLVSASASGEVRRVGWPTPGLDSIIASEGPTDD